MSLHPMKTMVCLIGAVLTPLVPLAAQDDARPVKFRVLCYEQVRDIVKGFVMSGGGDKQEVTFYTGGFGPQVSGSFTDGKVRFYEEKPGPEGTVVRSVVGEGKLADSPEQLFFLLPENKPNLPTYRVLAFDDQEKSFPMGATRVINMTPFHVRLTLAGKDLEPIKPGGMAVYPQVKAVDEWNMFTARIDFFAKAQWVPVSSQSWKASDRKRDWVITQIDPATHSPTIRLYQDIPPWRETVLPVGKGDDTGKPATVTP